jgi:hypothetical protein
MWTEKRKGRHDLFIPPPVPPPKRVTPPPQILYLPRRKVVCVDGTCVEERGTGGGGGQALRGAGGKAGVYVYDYKRSLDACWYSRVSLDESLRDKLFS